MSTSMRPLLAAEWRKLTTTKILWVLTAVGVLYSCLQVVTLVILTGGAVFEGIADAPIEKSMLLDPDYITTLLAQVGTAATFVLLLGIIAMTGEFRHMTITSTLLATPRRSRVLLAKMVTYGLLGAAIACVTLAFVLVAASVSLIPFEHAPITIGTITSVLLGAAIGMALYAILGVSIGSLITNQVAAIVTALVWVLLIEALAGLAFPSAARWLPGGALNSAMDVALRSDITGGLTQAETLPAWAGIAVLLAYTGVFAAVASRTTLRRDIT